MRHHFLITFLSLSVFAGCQAATAGQDGDGRICCTVNDPCGWAGNGVCDCLGQLTWDANDCGGDSGPTGGGDTLTPGDATLAGDSGPPVVTPPDYYIDCDSGDDGNAGTEPGLAWRTLERSDPATSEVSAGDTIWIRGTCPGNTTVNPTYREVLRLSSSASGTPGNVITWRNWPGFSNQIGGGADDDTHFSISTIGADYVRFEGLTFVGASADCIYVVWNSVTGDGSDGVEIVGNTFRRCGKGFVVNDANDCSIGWGHSAINVHHKVDGVLIDRNRIDEPGRSVSDTVRTTICDPLGQNSNHIYRHDHGLHLKGKGVVATNNVITNVCCGIGVKIDGYNASYTLGANEYSHTIINNTFGPNISQQPYDGCSGRPVVFSRTDLNPSLKYPRFRVENNLFIDPVPGNSISDCDSAFRVTSFFYDNMDPLNTCKNNINTGTETQSVCMDHVAAVAAVWTAGAVSGNTLNATEASLDLADAANHNYRIGASSTAINAGLSSPEAPAIDFDGSPRTGNPDVGAFEAAP